MNEFTIVTLILLGIAAIDAAGDAFRIHQWQLAHHILELISTVIAWVILWKFFEFQWQYLTMYITGRIWLFDPLLNWIAGYKLTYAGKSSIYGRILSWFMNVVKNPGILIWVIRAMALIWWVVWILTSGGR